MRLNQIYKFIFYVIFLLALDQGSKYFIQRTMVIGQTKEVIPQFFHITYVENPGAAFGMLAYKTPLFIGLTLLVLAGIFYYLKTLEVKNYLTMTAMAMIIAGALGNLIDRLRFGTVIDFIDFRGIWPFVFNIADIVICVGVGLLILEVLWKPKEEKIVEEENSI